MIAFNPDAQTLLMVVASDEVGILESAVTQCHDVPSSDADLPGRALSDTRGQDVSKVYLLYHSGWEPRLFYGMTDGSDTNL